MKGWRSLLVALATGLAGLAAHAEPLTNVSHVYTALKAGRYTDVEHFYAKLQRERTRKSDGNFLFEEFYRNTYWYSSSDPNDEYYWPKVDAATKAWIAHSPKSYLAAMTRAFVLAYRGEHVQAKGGSWKDVDRLAAEARRLMDGSRQTGAGDALWHATRLRVSRLEGAPRTNVVDMIHAAVAVDPYPVRLWQEAAIALSPDGRDTDDLLWLIRLAARRTAAQEGTSMYARVLSDTFWHFDEFLASPFGLTRLRWDEMHASFLDWKQRYPAGYSADLHGALACAAGDRETTSRLIAQIGAGPRDGTWELLGGKNHLSRCKEWAMPDTKAPTT